MDKMIFFPALRWLRALVDGKARGRVLSEEKLQGILREERPVRPPPRRRSDAEEVEHARWIPEGLREVHRLVAGGRSSAEEIAEALGIDRPVAEERRARVLRLWAERLHRSCPSRSAPLFTEERSSDSREGRHPPSRENP